MSRAKAMIRPAVSSTAEVPSLVMVIPALIERHVGDAAFYWRQPDKAARSPTADLG